MLRIVVHCFTLRGLGCRQTVVNRFVTVPARTGPQRSPGVHRLCVSAVGRVCLSVYVHTFTAEKDRPSRSSWQVHDRSPPGLNASGLKSNILCWASICVPGRASNQWSIDQDETSFLRGSCPLRLVIDVRLHGAALVLSGETLDLIEARFHRQASRGVAPHRARQPCGVEVVDDVAGIFFGDHDPTPRPSLLALSFATTIPSPDSSPNGRFRLRSRHVRDGTTSLPVRALVSRPLEHSGKSQRLTAWRTPPSPSFAAVGSCKFASLGYS